MTEEQAITAALGLHPETISEIAERCYDKPEEASMEDIRLLASYVFYVMNVG